MHFLCAGIMFCGVCFPVPGWAFWFGWVGIPLMRSVMDFCQCLDSLGEHFVFSLESLILAQDERWRRA